MNIKITADSTCDLSEELLRQWNISLMPMHILMGDDTYLDGVTIHPADVFSGPAMWKTPRRGRFLVI